MKQAIPVQGQLHKYTGHFLFIFLYACAITAQAGTPESLSSRLGGNYAQLSAGILYSRAGNLAGYLMRDDMLGKSYTTAPVGYNLGAEISASADKCVYALGIYNSFSSGSSGRGNARFGSNVAYLRTGYILSNRQARMCYIYTGIGAGHQYLRVANSADTGLLYSDTRNTVSPGVFRAYRLGCGMADIGLAFKRILVPVGREDDKEQMRGGVLLGIEAGCMLTWSGYTWKIDRYAVSGIPVPQTFYTPYIRLTIGPGGNNIW